VVIQTDPCCVDWTHLEPQLLEYPSQHNVVLT